MDGEKINIPSPYYEMQSGEVHFDEETALAEMLLEQVVFLNSHWWKKDEGWSVEDAKLVSVNVNCNDIFAWACADAESLPFHEIQNLYEAWKADPSWGPAKWCALRRNYTPQPPVVKAMKEAGVWDDKMEKLPEPVSD